MRERDVGLHLVRMESISFSRAGGTLAKAGICASRRCRSPNHSDTSAACSSSDVYSLRTRERQAPAAEVLSRQLLATEATEPAETCIDASERSRPSPVQD